MWLTCSEQDFEPSAALSRLARDADWEVVESDGFTFKRRRSLPAASGPLKRQCGTPVHSQVPSEVAAGEPQPQLEADGGTPAPHKSLPQQQDGAAAPKQGQEVRLKGNSQ